MLFGNLILASALAFDAGADLRIRHELMQNVPGCPNTGPVTTPCGKFVQHMRFRPRVWGEMKLTTEENGVFRLFARLNDEFRWNIEPYRNVTSWPGEVILDNLFLEGKGLFDGFLDFRFGRQDLFGYCGLNHIFVDGTPGDGSRSFYSDMAALTFHIDEENQLDLFGLYNFDSARDLRLGFDHQRFPSLTARYPNGDGNQDDWGYGAIWTSKKVKQMPWQVFAMQKRSMNAGKEYRNHTELVGVKLMPKWSDELSSTFEVMSQLDPEWAAYGDIMWKSTREGVRPYVGLGYCFLSKEWDPMWARGVDSEMFVYGTYNGVSWWSNMHFLKLSAGLEFSRYHSLSFFTGPMFAPGADGAGGGDGYFKGELTQAKYSFPIFTPETRGLSNTGERPRTLEIFGHIVFEHFQPGDYYESRKGAYFFRWQVEFKF